MKKLIGLCVALALGYFAYTRFLNRPVSEGEREIRRIGRAYDEAVARYGGANRMLGTSGMDTTADLADSVSAVAALKEDLEALVPRLADERERSRAKELEARMEKFLADRR